jgi:hypothetical protein
LGAFFRKESTTVQSHEVAAFGRFRKKGSNFSFGATSRRISFVYFSFFVKRKVKARAA